MLYVVLRYNIQHGYGDQPCFYATLQYRQRRLSRPEECSAVPGAAASSVRDGSQTVRHPSSSLDVPHATGYAQQSDVK